ncbi:MAG: GAF domain-containing protein [Halobacteria archaeon]|nr:GAF domain-containing protein [Halobacteria archaeon]
MTTTPGLRLLVLDPSSDTVTKTSDYLTQEGFDVFTASTVDEARAWVERRGTEIDCVVTEYQLGDITGVDLMNRLRDHIPQTPFVFYTDLDHSVASEVLGYSLTEYVEKSRADSDDVLDLLVKRIEETVEHRRAVEEERERRRVLEVIREINRAVTRSSTHESLKQRVCEVIAESEPYVFAWFGEYDDETRTVVPTEYAGVEAGYLDEIEIKVDGETSKGPTGRTVRNREVEVMQNIPEDPSYEPWREQALERGYRSSASVPAVYSGELYGTLNIYADRKFAFDNDEKELLREIGEDIGFGLNAIRTRQETERKSEFLSITETTADTGGWEYVHSADESGIEGKIRWTQGARRICCDPVSVDDGGETGTDLEVDAEEALGFVHPEDREEIRDGLVNMSEFDLTVRSNASESDGRDEKWIRVIGKPSEPEAETHAGEEVLMRGSIQDVTLTKERELRLDTYRRVIELSEDLIAAVDTDYRYIFANRRYVETHTSVSSPAAVEGESLREIVGDGIYDEIIEDVDSAFEGNHVEYEMERHGSFFHIQYYPLWEGDDGEVRGVAASLRDITDYKEYETEIENKNRQLTVLNRITRHDIRNDMNLILGWGDILRDHVDEEGEEYLRRTLNAARHTVDLTKNARDFVEAMGNSQTSEIDLGESLIQEVEKSKEVYEKAVFETAEIPDTEVIANSLVSTVFRNLLNNAVQHNDKETPRIEVSAEEKDEEVVVSVADNGPGIPDDQKKTVFGEGEKGPESEGTGIGLYLVSILVEEYGGDVWIEDNEPEGAVFKVRLRKA